MPGARTSLRRGPKPPAYFLPKLREYEYSSGEHLLSRSGLLLGGGEFRSEHDVVIGMTGRDHREDAFGVVGAEIDHGRHIADRERLFQHRVDITGLLAAQADAA